MLAERGEARFAEGVPAAKIGMFLRLNFLQADWAIHCLGLWRLHFFARAWLTFSAFALYPPSKVSCQARKVIVLLVAARLMWNMVLVGVVVARTMENTTQTDTAPDLFVSFQLCP